MRLENRYDGTHETQAPVPVGGSFAYRVTFPDPGVYWYHPHIREDYGQELGPYWSRLSTLPRAMRAGVTLFSPLLTRRPKRLSRQAGWD